MTELLLREKPTGQHGKVYGQVMIEYYGAHRNIHL